MTTYQNIHIRNHTARKTSRNTARITVESCSFIDPGRKPEIWRFYLNSAGVPQMHTGTILGKKAGETCALSIIVNRRDLICVRQKFSESADHQWNYYRIGTSYELIPVDLPCRCHSRGEIQRYLENTDRREPHQLEFSENDLQRFFSQSHPAWLSKIASRQLEHWKRYKPKKYFLFAPVEAAGTDMTQCIRAAPYAALARFQHRLTQKQISHCVSRSPLGAIIHSFDKIPPEKGEPIFLNIQPKLFLTPQTS